MAMVACHQIDGGAHEVEQERGVDGEAELEEGEACYHSDVLEGQAMAMAMALAMAIVRVYRHQRHGYTGISAGEWLGRRLWRLNAVHRTGISAGSLQIRMIHVRKLNMLLVLSLISA